MANFVPYWYSASTSSTISEGHTEDFIFRIKKNAVSDVDTYTVQDNQYLEINFTLSSIGDTFTEKDVVVTAGETRLELTDISLIDPSYNGKLGTYTVVLKNKDYDLSSTQFKDAYYIRVNMVDDGIWDGPETLQVVLNYVHVKTTNSDGDVTSVQVSGITSTAPVLIKYDALNEIWVTPGIVVYGDQKSSIGSISYGSESRLFVQAFGKSRPYNAALDSTGIYGNDRSSRVFVPAYNAEFNSNAFVPTSHITGRGTYLIPNVISSTEETALNIADPATGNIVRSGLSFLFNGQIVQTFTYDSDPIDGYIRIKIIDPMTVWTDPENIYYEGKRFRAYQYWIAPQDVSTFKSTGTAVQPGHLYMLKDTAVYPYVVKTVQDDFGNIQFLFEPDIWLDMGVYEVSLGEGIIDSERIFRIVMNANTGDDLVITTDSNLGQIRCGEYFGHSVYPKIEATGDKLITFEIHESSTDNIRKYGLDLTADGYLYGTCFAKSSDFDANDFINLSFVVQANNRKGRKVLKTFNLRITRGAGEHVLSAYAVPSKTMERMWFETISTDVFSKMKYYRTSDPRYGLQRLPRILLKENYLDSTEPYISLKDTKSKLRTALSTENTFKLTIGNYKIRSAIDNDGNVIYDVLYLELLPYGYSTAGSIKPYDYSSKDTIVEFYTVREAIKTAIGEDSYNISLDPEDYKNRAIVVNGIDGISTPMIDTLPRHMVHPDETHGASTGLVFEIPVAYLEPGTGETLFFELVQAGQHLSLLNNSIDVQSIQFICYNPSSDTELNIADTFVINL